MWPLTLAFARLGDMTKGPPTSSNRSPSSGVFKGKREEKEGKDGGLTWRSKRCHISVVEGAREEGGWGVGEKSCRHNDHRRQWRRRSFLPPPPPPNLQQNARTFKKATSLFRILISDLTLRTERREGETERDFFMFGPASPPAGRWASPPTPSPQHPIPNTPKNASL